MGTTLTGTFISQTYDSLIKVTDNDNLTSTAKRLTDGLGNDSPLFLSTTKLGVGVTPTTTFQVAGNSQLGGNLTVTGNLIVQGTTTTVDTDTLSVKDPLIIVGSDNTSSDAVDLGFYGVYDTSGSLDLYAGLFRDASDAKFHLFKDLQTEPTTTVNKSGTGYTKAGLVVGPLEATTGSFTGNIEATSFIQSNNNFLTKGTLKFSNNADSSFINGFRRVSGADTLELLNISNINTSEGSGVTFGGTITVSGGDITLGGTGRIQGIDTVSASTDAANKAYVDSQIAANNELSEVLTNGNTTGGNNIVFGDSATIGTDDTLIFGAGNDLRIAHNGTDSVIRNFTGGLYIDQEVDDGDIIFRSDNGSGGKTEYFKLDGSLVNGTTTLGATSFPDKSKIFMGAGSDLQIYHDGSNSYIDDAGTGDLYIRANNLRLANADGSEATINANNGGAVEIHHAGSKKFETTSAGATITGNLQITGSSGDTLTLTKGSTEPSLRIEGDTDKDFVMTVSGELLTFTQNDGSTDILTLDHDTKNATFTGDITIDAGASSTLNIYKDDAGNGKLSFYNDSTQQVFLLHDSAENFYIHAGSGSAMILSTNGATTLTLDTGNNATFAGNITIAGGQ